MSKYKKAIFPALAAVACTVGWIIDASTVPAAVAAGSWIVLAGVFGLKNAPA